jgi:hypothetical protein
MDFRRILFLALIGAFGWALVRHNNAAGLENKFGRVGGRYLYETHQTGDDLKNRVSGETTLTLGEGTTTVSGAQMIDRLFGKITAVAFDPVMTPEGPVPPSQQVEAVLKAPDLEVVLFNSVPLMDEFFLRLGQAPKLREIGLRKTKVTLSAIEKLKSQRPGLEVIEMKE